MTYPPLQVGSIVLAKRATAACAAGERKEAHACSLPGRLLLEGGAGALTLAGSQGHVSALPAPALI